MIAGPASAGLAAGPATTLPSGDGAEFKTAMLAWTAAVPAPALVMAAPVPSSRISSPFGERPDPITATRRFHSGIDLPAPLGTPVTAAADGVVRRAGLASGYGELVTIGHGESVETRYGHLSRLLVTAGEIVRRGDVIGLVGSTGHSTGPHLHFEVRENGRALDPDTASLAAQPAPPMPVVPHWLGWTSAPNRLPSAF